jgi:NADP-dependent 3-hydroxy acid dehydrogenase YdfG
LPSPRGRESWESSDEEWELMFKLNVATMRDAIKATVPQMLEKQGGSIVNVGAYGACARQGAKLEEPPKQLTP